MRSGGLLIHNDWCACNKTARWRQGGHRGKVEAEIVVLWLKSGNAKNCPQTSNGYREARKIPLQVSAGTWPGPANTGTV